jgi:hypothetical protein
MIHEQTFSSKIEFRKEHLKQSTDDSIGRFDKNRMDNILSTEASYLKV